MLVVEQWAELRRLHFSENAGIRELARRFGPHRTTLVTAFVSQIAEPAGQSGQSHGCSITTFAGLHGLL